MRVTETGNCPFDDAADEVHVPGAHDVFPRPFHFLNPSVTDFLPPLCHSGCAFLKTFPGSEESHADCRLGDPELDGDFGHGVAVLDKLSDFPLLASQAFQDLFPALARDYL